MGQRSKRSSQQSAVTMRAAVQMRAKSPLVVTDMFKPVPPRSNPLVRVHTVGINQHDVRMRDHGLYISGYPAVMGSDVAGTIEQANSSMAGFQLGDRVAYMASPFVPIENGLQEYTIVNAAYLIRLPGWISFEAAATLGTNLLASWVALFSPRGIGLQLPPFTDDEGADEPPINEGILITGGCSHIGHYAIQLARLAGCYPIITTATRFEVQDKDLLGIGATHVLDKEAPDLIQQIKYIMGEDLMYAFDPETDTSKSGSNHLLAQEAISNTRYGGRVVTVSQPRPREQWANKAVAYETISVLGVNDNHPELARELVNRLPTWLEDGRIITDEWEIAGTLEDADSVLTRVKQGVSTKRQLVRVIN